MAGSMASLRAFYNAVTALVNRGRVTDVSCLDFCRAFDTVPYHVLVYVLDRRRSLGGQENGWMITLSGLWSMY